MEKYDDEYDEEVEELEEDNMGYAIGLSLCFFLVVMMSTLIWAAWCIK